jgi:hypothetical protein
MPRNLCLRLLVSTSIATASALTLFHSTPAVAQACSPASPVNGDVVVCSGTGSGIRNNALDGATITVEEGSQISGGADQGFLFDDDVQFTNGGSVTSTGDHAVQGDNDVTVINNGTISGGDDGVNIDDDGRIENSGTISGGDDGVQVESNGTVINRASGIITATDEGVNANQPNAVIENHGIIEAGDDAVNAGTNATITNSGRITSTGDQDGIDLDDGSVTNSGLIESLGNEDGIDFDPSTEASRVTNSGTIRGAIAINTDPSDTGSQTVVNSGVLIGRSGIALNLGDGDDTVILNRGSKMTGAIEMGGGADTLEVNYIGLERLLIGSAIETVITAGPSIIGNSAIILLDPEQLGAADRDAQDLAFNLSHGVLMGPKTTGLWVSGQTAVLGEGERNYLGGMFGYDFDLGGHALGIYGAVAKAGDLDAWLAGLRYNLVDSGPFGLQATAFAGITNRDSLAGSGDTDGTLFGISARASYIILEATPNGFGLDVAVEGGLNRYTSNDYTMSDLDTSIDERDSNAGYARAELGVPLFVGSETTLRGFGHVTHHQGSADSISATFEGVSTEFESGADLDQTAFGVGASFNHTMANGLAVDARIETAHADGDSDFAFGLTLGMPLGY